MKHRLLFFSLTAAIFCSANVKAQAVTDCANMYWGSSARYPAPQNPLTPTPKDYTPIFINYVGRNTSTFLDNDISTSFTYATLQKADSAHALKAEAKKLRDMLLLIQRIEKGKQGVITQAGTDEMAEIGIRIQKNFAEVFAGGKCVKVSSVNEKPMLQTAEAMVKGLGTSLNAPGCEKLDLKDDDNLAPFKVSPALITFATKGDWKDYADDYRENKKPKNFNTRFMARFFEESFLDNMSDDLQSKFVTDMYDLGEHVNAIQTEIVLANIPFADVDIRSFFTCQESEVFSKAISTGEFFKSAAGIDKTGMQVRSAVPLLINLLNSTDSYSIDQKHAAWLRFTSSESIAALATLLNFKGSNSIAKNAYNVDRFWNAEQVIPMGANIQMIFYKGTSADTRSYYLVKFLLNEVEMEIDGLSYKNYKYYLWDDVKAFLKRKLADDMEVGAMNDNMHTYLLNLK